MQKITPFLWFNNQAEEAAKFYVSIFKNSKVGKIARYDEAASSGLDDADIAAVTELYRASAKAVRS